MMKTPGCTFSGIRRPEQRVVVVVVVVVAVVVVFGVTTQNAIVNRAMSEQYIKLITDDHTPLRHLGRAAYETPAHN